MNIYEFEGTVPVIKPSAYVHPTAVIIGDVWIGENCYIGPLSCLRGDFSRIVIKDNSNIQEGCTLHGFPKYDLLLEEGSHIGHGAIIHTATIRRNVLIGMQALVLDYAEIGQNSIVAAQSLVPNSYKVPENTLVMGAPCKIIRTLDQETIANKSSATDLYTKLAKKSLQTLKPVLPLSEGNSNRPRINWEKDCDIHSLQLTKKRG